MREQTITCPNCGKRIHVSEALTLQIENELRKSFEAETQSREQEAEERFHKRLSAEKARVEKQAKSDAEQIASAQRRKLEKELSDAQKRERTTQANFDRRLADEGARLEKQARKTAEVAVSSRVEQLQKDLQRKERELRDVAKQRAEVQRLQDRLAAREKAIDGEVARRAEKAVRKAEQDATKRTESEHRTRELELEKKLNDAKRQAVELKRRLEQSSQQTQGSIVELELGNALRKAFPDDEIEPVSKVKGGADFLQRICGPDGQDCGVIIWESKSTNLWAKAWLSKLRSDQRRAHADLAVIVSKALPKNIQHFGLLDGVWVTELPFAIALAVALRNHLVQVGMIKLGSSGKQERFELLFRYTSGTDFKHRVEAIVEAFWSMQDDLERERQILEKNWAKREKATTNGHPEHHRYARRIAGNCGIVVAPNQTP